MTLLPPPAHSGLFISKTFILGSKMSNQTTALNLIRIYPCLFVIRQRWINNFPFNKPFVICHFAQLFIEQPLWFKSNQLLFHTATFSGVATEKSVYFSVQEFCTDTDSAHLWYICWCLDIEGSGWTQERPCSKKHTKTRYRPLEMNTIVSRVSVNTR